MMRINNSLKFYNKRFDDYCTENRIARQSYSSVEWTSR